MAQAYHYRKPAVLQPEHRSGRNILYWFLGFLVLGMIGFGVKQAVRSSLFTLRTVVVEPLSSNYPLSREQVLQMADVRVGMSSLFELKLAPIEARLLEHPWVKGVVVGKQFPGTLSLRVVERTPVALLTEANGKVLYLESDGSAFEDKSMVYPGELPIFTGFSSTRPEVLRKLNGFVQKWFGSGMIPGLKLSSLSYDEKLGLRAMISYPMKNQRIMRTVLELGLNLEDAAELPMERLKKVLEYIGQRSQPASKIWLGNGKKIVVKFSRGS
ncbi:MAG: FtsQ-type POTRA domain-containing protein [Bdellovibrionales bacterium]|nr:FtsQ-type POTRA domain-containing protein [Bdellovibrionales bacterium]